MKRHGRVLLALLATVALAGAACSKSSSGTANSPTPGGNTSSTISPSGVAGQPSGSPSEGGTPTFSPGSTTGTLKSGAAQVTVSGGVTANMNLTSLSAGVFSPPPGGMALVWNDNSGQALGIGGQSFTGNQNTTATLVLTFGVLSSGGGFEQFTSAKGECTVIIETAEDGHVAGTFKCSDVPGSSGTSADASGTFEATG